MYFRNMKRTLYIILGIFLCATALHSEAQSRLRPGQWRTYLSHIGVIQSAFRGGTLYTISSAGMFTFDPATNEIQTYSSVDGLSNINPNTLFYSQATDRIFIGYPDGNIDYFNEVESIRTLTDIARSNNFVDKRIIAFAGDADFLYVATGFGLVIYRFSNLLPLVTVTQFGNGASRRPIVSVARKDGLIWVVTEDGDAYSAPAGFPNLSDPSVWTLENGANGLPLGVPVNEVVTNPGAVYLRTDLGIFANSGNSWNLLAGFSEKFDKLYAQSDGIAASQGSRLVVEYTDGTRFDFFGDAILGHALWTNKGEFYLTTPFIGVRRAGNGTTGLILPSGPLTNLSTEVAAYNGEIYIAPRGYGAAFVPINDQSGVYYFNSENGWKALDRNNGGLPKNRVNTGFARAFYDKNSGQAYLGSFGKGIAVVEKGELVDYFDCYDGLSTIGGVCDSASFDQTRVSGLEVDINGVLWATLTFAQHPLVLRTTEGQWLRIPANRFPSNAFFIKMITDDLGSKWILNRNNGLVVYNDNNTPDNLTDDRIVNINPIQTNISEEGCSPTGEVFSIAKDLDGAIWVGTAQGVIVFFDPFSIAQGKVVPASRIIFDNRCLLENEIVYAIAVDGGNRKWFATGNGVFLTNASGDKLIRQFTTANSPLLSNQVNHIAIDPITGEVIFSTDKGIIAYGGDATEGVGICEEVRVFPNPVFSDFLGDIVIEGSAANSRVKIVTVSGKLVRELRSEGGTTRWDGLDLRGEKVHSGIYLALVADENGENACVGKFAVIRR